MVDKIVYDQDDEEEYGYVDQRAPTSFIAARVSQNLVDLCDQVLELCDRGKLPYQYKHRSDIMKAALHTYCMGIMKKGGQQDTGITQALKLLQKHQQHEAMLMDLRDSVKSFVGILQDHVTDGEIDRALKLLHERLSIARKIDDPYWKKRHETMLFESLPQVLKDRYFDPPFPDHKDIIVEAKNDNGQDSSTIQS